MSVSSQPVFDLPNLDIMRSFAVLFVVASHVLTQFQFPIPKQLEALGITGVLIFFVHTCLVLMFSLERKPYPLDFFIRRVFRIYPAAMVVILVTILFKLPALNLGPKTGFQYVYPSHMDDLFNLLLLQNYRGRLIVGVTWSLPYEMQMYLLLPMMFFYVVRNLSVWTVVSLWVFVLATCLLAWGPAVPMSLLLCNLYFLPGIMAYVGFKRWRPVLPAWSFPVALFALTAILLIRFNLYGAGFFCLTLGLVLPRFRQSSYGLLNQGARIVAKYSYGIYLVHTLANYVGVVKLQQFPLVVRLLAVPVLTVPIAYVLYHLVEEPLIRAGVALARRAERIYQQEVVPEVLALK